jgi:hypothetical protein
VWERDLLRVDEAHPDGAPIIPELGRSNSELRLHCADVDGDGQDELLVGLGEWRGYDLRVYEGGPEGYHLRARTGRTATTAITTVPDPAGPGRLIVSLEADTHSNANRHGLHDPDGPPSAVLLRRLEGDRLKDLWAWPLPGEFERVGAFAAGDLDGDGAEELVFGLSSGSHYLLFLGRLRADAAGFAFGVHPGLYPYALQQLDGDPAPELIVGRLPPGETVPTASEVRWILGRGGAGFPSLPPAPPAAGLEVPAPDLRGGAERVWRDAALLFGAGLRQSAAELLLRSATEAHDPLRATAAADLWTTMGHEADAARAEEQGAWSSPPGDAAPRWQAAVERWLHAAEPDEALRVAEAWRAADGAGPSGALADRLQAWSTARASSLRLEPGVAPGADWEVVEPLAFDLRAGQTHIDSLGGQPRLAALSLQPTGGPVALFLDLTIERLEWNSASRVGFGGGPLRSGVTFGASGAEKVHTFRAFFEGCVGDAEQPSSMNQHLTLPPSPTAERPAFRMRARFSWSPGDGVWRCSIELPDLGQAHSAARPLALPAALDLSLGDLREDTGSWQRFRLDRLEVWGVRAAPTRGDPLQAARQAALREDPTRALALLPSDAALERAILLGRLRRPAEAIAAFRVALETDRPTLLRRVAWLLRAHRDTYSPLLRAASGPDWPTLFDAAWNIPVIGNHQAPWIDEALRTELEAVPLPAVGGDPAWFVLCYRAMALLHGPEPERGRAAAAEWLAAFDRLSPGVEAPERRLASLLHRELALDALTRGDRATAQVEADRAVERSPTPTLAPDFFRLSPVWQAAGLPVPVSRPAPEPGTPSPPPWAD